jgi:drug/metabolite transporter (DMT)-like permease
MVAILLFGALLHATWNALIRSAADKFLDAVLIISGMGILAACWLPFIPLPAVESWPFLTASIVIHTIYFVLVILTYRQAELSFAYPIMRGAAPAFSALAVAVLLKESPSPVGWAGILLICCGVITLSMDSWQTGSLKRSALVLALANAGIIVLYTIVDGVGVRRSGNAVSYVGWMLALSAVPVVVASLGTRRHRVTDYWRRHALRGIAGGACLFGSYSIALWAMSRAPIALVAALRETSVLFGVGLAVLFLGERVSYRSLVAIMIVVAGAVAIKIS